MRIVFQHSDPLPVRTYGGIERILFWHMKELARLGMDVTLIGHKDSQVEEFGIKLIPQESESTDWRTLIPKKTDIVHLFYPPPTLDVPVISWIGGNGKPGEYFHPNTVFVSKNHAAFHRSECFVYNGIDLSEYPYQKGTNKNWQDFLFLAKAKWKVKNVRDCIRACRGGQKHLFIAGGKVLTLSRFVHSHGMVNQEEKRNLLNRADALLFPVRWQEPFGIAVIEAFASGLPVVGSVYGSLPELIQDHTGVLCKNYEEFAMAVKTCPKNFNSDDIRDYVEDRFSIQKISPQFIPLYEKVISGKNLNVTSPRAIFSKNPQTLLPF